MIRWYTEIYASMLDDPVLMVCIAGVAIFGGIAIGIAIVWGWYDRS
jgi:hypothetical protein